MTEQQKLVKFMNDNEINFEVLVGSELNGPCTVISGYADYIDATKHDVKAAIKEKTGVKRLNTALIGELNKVYAFASTYNYGRWWHSEEASRIYKF
jgi:hypothetical protein